MKYYNFHFEIISIFTTRHTHSHIIPLSKISIQFSWLSILNPKLRWISNKLMLTFSTCKYLHLFSCLYTCTSTIIQLCTLRLFHVMLHLFSCLYTCTSTIIPFACFISCYTCFHVCTHEHRLLHLSNDLFILFLCHNCYAFSFSIMICVNIN